MDAHQKLVEAIAELQRAPHAAYPYLIVRLLPAVYGVAPLPASLDREQLIDLALRESASRDHALQMCVVFADDDALYVGAAGASEGPRPWGGRVVLWTLAASKVAADTTRTLQ